jgi:diguanylate cyclase (GGDEF)-like protein
VTADDDFSIDDDGEQTAVVNLADLRGLRKPQQDRHLLVRVQGTQLGEVQRLGPGITHVGRSQESELWLPDDGVSRRHARFLPDPTGRYILEDLQSANGTFVQGERIVRRVLHDGDLVQIGPTAVFRYSVADEDQEALLRQLYAASVTDALTGAHKREHFDAQLQNELSYARRHQRDCSVVLFDLDHFKRLNDTYGHPAGDEVLSVMAQAVRKELRAEDMLARYGGEEFAIILRAIDVQGAAMLAERLRSQVEALVIDHEGRQLKVTLSAGCASVRELGDSRGDELVALADRRLYAAKRAGRNRVVATG